jgi:hypothetical protein
MKIEINERDLVLSAIALQLPAAKLEELAAKEIGKRCQLLKHRFRAKDIEAFIDKHLVNISPK